MDQDPAVSSWNERMPDNTMAATTESQDDMANFLDLDFDFSGLDGVVDQSSRALPSSSSYVPTTTMMQDVQLTGVVDHQQVGSQQTTPIFHPQTHSQPMEIQGTTAVQPHMKLQFYPQNHHQPVVSQPYGPQHPYIPPTPTSMEMLPRTTTFPMRVDTETHHRGYESYLRSADEQTAFTPLQSPAMTPLENQYRLPEYAVPGEYFTPLTSPALEGRNPNNPNGYVFHNHSQIDMAFMSSPMDLPAHSNAVTAPSSPGVARNHRRRQSLQSRTGSRFVRQSPSVKPRTGRPRQTVQGDSQSEGASLHPSSNVVSDDKSRSLGTSSSNSGSGQDSVSPEPLTEPLMPPPALPRSSKSPAIPPQESNPSSMSAADVVTPATLMKLPNQPIQESPSGQFSRSGSIVVNDAPAEAMEDIVLPDPASGSVEPISAHSTLSDHRTTPRASDRPGTNSVGPSPQIGAMSPPMGPTGVKRPESKPSTRTAKKRQSASSAQISPAIRPKMSPSIKPLIPGGEGMTPETSAVYLASKSNYQHILEGTVLPGLHYPESLVENLSSKRTNHKLAEQGRRNRINNALKEIEALLPAYLASPEPNKDKDRKEGNGNTNNSSKTPTKPTASQPISKASTVEMAILYIKELQRELAETKEKLKLVEEKAKANGVPEAYARKEEYPPPDPGEVNENDKTESLVAVGKSTEAVA